MAQVGARLTRVAGSYLHTVQAGDWEACRTCALPVKGYSHCPQCASHLGQHLPLADRTGYLVYADMPVKGHWFLPGGGHETCPVAATRIARWWPWDLPRGGHRRPGSVYCNGFTPLPVSAWVRRTLSPLV